MTIFVAGGSGTIGLPLVRALVDRRYRVVATTRSAAKGEELRRLGATPVMVDVFDAAALERAVREASPTHVIHQLTALPKAGPRHPRDLLATNRLRDDGTRNLLRAAQAAGAARLIAGSFAPLGAPQASSQPQPSFLRDAVRAVRSMESQIAAAARAGPMEGIVLRYGMFYGPGNPGTAEMIALVRRRRLPVIRGDRGLLPFIHMDDAVAATVAALQHGPSGRAYDIVDDQPVCFSDVVKEMARLTGAPRPFAVPAWLLRLAMPFMAHLLMQQLPLSNASARADLDWRPTFTSYREGLRQTLEHGV